MAKANVSAAYQHVHGTASAYNTLCDAERNVLCLQNTACKNAGFHLAAWCACVRCCFYLYDPLPTWNSSLRVHGMEIIKGTKHPSDRVPNLFYADAGHA